MAAFTDRTGRDWPVDVNIDLVRRLRRAVDKLDLMNPSDVGRMMKDPALMLGVLWQAVEPVADRRGVDYIGFDNAIADDATLTAAIESLLESLASFSLARGNRAMAILMQTERRKNNSSEKTPSNTVMMPMPST